MKRDNEVTYVDDKSILVITRSGSVRQIYVPFPVTCAGAIGNIKKCSQVYVSSVMQHEHWKIIFEVYGKWYPYTFFRILITG